MHSPFKPKPAWADFPCNSPFFSPNLLQLGFLQRTQSLCYFHSHHQLLQNKQGNWKYQSISGFERMKVNVLNTEAENNVLVSTTHHHSWELSIPICNTSAAPAVTIKNHTALERLPLQIHVLICNCAAKEWASAAALKSHRGQEETECASPWGGQEATWKQRMTCGPSLLK